MASYNQRAGSVAVLCLTLVAFWSCTTANVATDVKPVPAPKSAAAESELAPMNETVASTSLLAPAAKLAPDTLEAARYDYRASKIFYIGAWATDDAGCAKIDQGPFDGFAVITPKSIRQNEEICAINAAPSEDNPASLQASCKAAGATASRQITLFVTAIGGLQLINKAGAAPIELVRCELSR